MKNTERMDNGVVIEENDRKSGKDKKLLKLDKE